jgi:hypothetical protein
MSHEVSPEVRSEAAKTTGEVVPRLPLRDSVVVFGSRVSGAHALATEFEAIAAERGLNSDAVQWTRHAEGVPDVFFGRATINRAAADTVPRGVIAFPYMYQGNTAVDTALGDIDILCEQHGVPLIWAERQEGEQFSLPAAIGGLLTPQPEQAQIQG